MREEILSIKTKRRSDFSRFFLNINTKFRRVPLDPESAEYSPERVFATPARKGILNYLEEVFKWHF